MDDVYFVANHHSFFQASINFGNLTRSLKKNYPLLSTLTKLKKVVFQNENYYCVVGGQKGGIMRVYDNNSNKLVFSDSGYIGHTNRNQIIRLTMVWKDCRVIFLHENETK